MKARFIGDPRELESGKPLSRAPEQDWFEVPEGMENKYRNNDHYETDDAPAKGKRKAKVEPKAEPKPAIETDPGDEEWPE